MTDDRSLDRAPTTGPIAHLRWCAKAGMPELVVDALAELSEPMEEMSSAYWTLIKACSAWLEDRSDPTALAALSSALHAFEEHWSVLVGPDSVEPV